MMYVVTVWYKPKKLNKNIWRKIIISVCIISLITVIPDRTSRLIIGRSSYTIGKWGTTQPIDQNKLIPHKPTKLITS